MERAPQHCRREPSMPQIVAVRLARGAGRCMPPKLETTSAAGTVKQGSEDVAEPMAVDVRTTARSRLPKRRG